MKLTKKAFTCWLFLLVIFSACLKDLRAESDKLKHFGVSAMFGVAAESLLHYKTDFSESKRIVWGTVLGSVSGLAKEIADSTEKGNRFSGADLAADVAGAFFGALVGNLVNNLIQVKAGVSRERRAAFLSVSFKFFS